MNSLSRRITLGAAVLAPILMVASTLSYMAQGDGMNDGVAGGAIMIWSMIAYGVAVVGFARLLESSAPRGAVALVLVGVTGISGGVGYGIDSIQVALFGNESIQETTSAAAPLVLQLPGLLFPLSLVLLGVLLARTATVPAPLSYALAVGAILFPSSRIPDIAAVAVVSDVIVLLALLGVVARLDASAAGTRSRVVDAAV